MSSYLTTIIRGSLCACLLGSLSVKADNYWKPAAEIKLETIEKMAAKLKDKAPTMLAYKVALFLASGSADTPTQGRHQTISADFSGGEETFNQVTVTVEFMGYADDSLRGERFVIQLNTHQEGIWKVTKITRAAYGRGDHL